MYGIVAVVTGPELTLVWVLESVLPWQGRVTVVMVKTDYNDKMGDLVNDKQTYEALTEGSVVYSPPPPPTGLPIDIDQ